MFQLRYKQWLVSLVVSLALFSVPTLAHATAFTFSESILGGGIFSGSFTISPDPSLPLTFNGPLSAVTSYTFSTLSVPFLSDVTLTDANSLIQSFEVTAGFLTLLAVSGTTLPGLLTFGGGVIVISTPTGGFDIGVFPASTIPLTVVPDPGTPIPEPGTAMLLMTGLLGLAGYRWLQRRREKLQTA